MASEIWESGELDLGEGREGNENICIYTISSRFIQTQTHFIHLCLYKSERGERDCHQTRVASEIHQERGEIAIVCYEVQLNQTIFIAFNLN